MSHNSDEYGVEVKCTNCSLSRTFEDRSEIPERFRDGCPNCHSDLSVKPIGS